MAFFVIQTVGMKSLFEKHRTLVQYFFIGISAAGLDFILYVFLFNALGWSAWVSTSVSISVATVYAFTLNMFYNFRLSDQILVRLISYSFVSGVGLLISTAALYEFTDVAGYDGNLVKALTLPVIFLVQYLLNKHITFRAAMKLSLEGVVANSKSNQLLEERDFAKKQLAVIGGGFAGLSAAYELALAGHDVTVFEFSDHLGGLASGFSVNDYPIERAYHFLYQSDEDILGFASELGIRDQITFYPSSIRYFHEGTDYPFMTPLDLLRFTPLSFVDRIRLGVFTLYLKHVKNWRPLSKVTAYAWLNKWMGKNVTREIWEPLLRGKFAHYYDQITMSWLWGRFNIRARSQNKDLSGEKLGYPRGGFGAIVTAIETELEKHKVTIKTNTGIRSISSREQKTHITTLDGQELVFDGVVTTVPSGVFAKMVADDGAADAAYLAKLNSIEYLEAVVMVFRTTQRLTDAFWYNIKDERVPFLTLLSPSALAGTEQWEGSEVYFVGAYVPADHRYMQPNTDVVGEWKAGLKVMFPDFDESQIQDLKLSKFKNAQHIVDIGYEEEKLVPFTTPLPGVYLANFSQIYPDDRGTNFAVRDGRAAARELINYLHSDE